MSNTITYEFGAGGTQTAEGSSGLSGTYFYIYTPAVISHISVEAAQKNVAQDSFVTCLITTSDNRTIQETVQITGSRAYCDFSVEMSVNENTWVNITFYTNNSYIYWKNTNTNQLIAGGWTGSSAYAPSNIQPYCVKFNITYDEVWTIDELNAGYVREARYAFTVFNEFSKDVNGYPTNNSAWKFDNQNGGYPWITGFSKIIPEPLVYHLPLRKIN